MCDDAPRDPPNPNTHAGATPSAQAHWKARNEDKQPDIEKPSLAQETRGSKVICMLGGCRLPIIGDANRRMLGTDAKQTTEAGERYQVEDLGST